MTIIKTITYTTVTLASDESGSELNTSVVGSNLLDVLTPNQTSWIRVNTDGTVETRTQAESIVDLGMDTASTRKAVVGPEDNTTSRLVDVAWINANTQGTKNNKALAFGYYTGNSTETAITTAEMLVDVVNPITLSPLSHLFETGNGLIEYTGTLTGTFKVSVDLDVEEDVNISTAISVNGSTMVGTRKDKGHTESLILLEQGDEIGVKVSNNDSTDNLTITNLSVIVERVK